MNHTTSTATMAPVQSNKSFGIFRSHRSYRSKCACILFISLLTGLTIPKAVESVEEFGQAQVKHLAQETTFNTIQLTPKAEERLGIKTVAIERRAVNQTRLYGGELILPLNQLAAGAKRSSSKDTQSVFTILPLMTPADQIRVAEAQVNADGQVQAAKVQVDAAQVLLARAQRLLRDHAGSQRAVDEANVQFRLAQATLAEAHARRQLLGPPLLAIASPDRFWIRVPVYVGVLNDIHRRESARMEPLGNFNGQSGVVADPVSAPPSSNPIAATVDLFYEVANSTKEWQLGQKVQVFLPLMQTGDSLVVPWSAVIVDIYGGTWVYNKRAPHTFVRERVQVSFIQDSEAVLASGPTPGSEIVVQGAAELFGTEVGFGQ
jgi:multidrug efflux pump subunit AcrA (membrane-fusion protein)